MSLRNSLRHACVLTAVVGLVGVAVADTSDVVFEIAASNAAGSGVYTVLESDGAWDGEHFIWQSDGPIEITGEGRDVIATLNAGDIELYQDPQVNLGFSVQAGATDTSFTISSALLSFSMINSPEGRASAAFTVTDTNNNGGSLTGLGPNSGSYLAQYNGFVPVGTAFAEELSQVDAPVGGSQFGFANVPALGYLPLLAPASNMSSMVTFSLTANDIASGTTFYEIIIPEPTGLLLLVAGLVCARRR